MLALDHDGGARTFTVDPVALGLAPATHDQLVGGDPEHNADVVRRVLDGEHGAHRDIVVLNAAAALVVAGAADDLAGGLAVAEQSIDSGKAAAALDAMVAGVAGGRRSRDHGPGAGLDRQPRAGVRRSRPGARR